LVEIEHGHMRTADPRWRELRPEGEDHQDTQRGHPIDEQLKRLLRGWVAPVDVLPHHQHWLLRCQSFDSGQLGVKRFLLALLGSEVQWWVALAGWDR
jgi:hypothetical protein